MRACFMSRRPVLLAVLFATSCAASAPLPPAPVAVAPAPPPAAPPSPAPESVATASAAPSAEPAKPPSEPAAPPKPRLHAQGYPTRIYGRPKVDERLIGLIRYGTSVALQSTDLVRGEGCRGGFYQIEPRGYVCNDRAVTLTPSARFVDVAASVATGPGPLPYRYAFSDGAPMYNRVPSAAEQARTERGFGPTTSKRKYPKKRSSYEDLASLDPIEPTDERPPFLTADGRLNDARAELVKEKIPARSMLAFTRAFAAGGRTFLLSADYSLVPADRVRVFKPSTFHGTKLGGDVQLPLAWMRATPKTQHRRAPSGAFEETSGTWPAKGFVRLTGASAEEGRTRYLETMDRDAGGAPLWIAEKDATVMEAAKRLGNGVKPGQKWMVVSISQGTLVAYEGMTPVYATLMSPGRGGIPIKGHDNVADSTTPLGTYNITFKDKVSTMSPDKPGEPRTNWIADVPHTQYFDPPFALHAAYWHDRFGEPTSAGCVNVSPIDAEALFKWSDPQVPEEWQGATGAGAPENGPMTAIVIRR
ncbi:Hypothetical protein A7982_06293 [Minicystis rosea]|nr:Hypothetical protein A7982_06293 [Minicystis rosea]